MKNYHSRSYHHFFEGYTEKGITSENGKHKILRIYTGDYYEPRLSSKEKKKYKLTCGFSYVMAAVLFFVCGISRAYVNLLMPVALLESILLCLLLLLARSVFYICIQTEPYMIRKYRIISEKLRSYAKGAAVCCWIIAGLMAAAMLYLTVKKWGADMESLLCTAGFAACGVLLYSLYRTENKLTYEQKRSSALRPEKGVDILL